MCAVIPRDPLPVPGIHVLLPNMPSQIDFGMVESRIRDCDESPEHLNCRAPTHTLGEKVGDVFPGLKTFRLIDVEEMKVVEFPSAALLPSQYVALSYIWGAAPTIRSNTANMPLFTQKDGLLEAASFMLPRTIMDAIAVVWKLRLPYLWVDTLCLVQNDDEDLRLGVDVMDLIYETAYLVIVAAEGHDANAGLPGVYEGTRYERQNSWQVTNDLALGISAEVNALLAKSTYHTRGWTFQEYMLARRALVFVDGRLIFRCLTHYWPEDTTQPMSGDWESFYRGGKAPRTWDDFKKLLPEYTSRQFADDGDALRAIEGILRRLSRSTLAGSGHIQGVPIHNLEEMLLFGSANVPLRRRPLFPSYSWAGWRGCQTYGKSHLTGGHRLTLWINFYVLEKPFLSGEPILTGERGDPARAFDFPEFSVHQPVGSDDQRPFPTVPTITNNSPAVNLAERPYSLLQFWTFVIRVTLAGIDPITAVARVMYQGSILGKAWLDGFDEGDFFHSRREFEVIILCNDAPRSGGLLVERMNGGWFERRGAVEIDFVGEEFHLNWEEIILG